MAKKDRLTAMGSLIEKKIRAAYGSNLSFSAACGVDEKTVRKVIAGDNVSLKMLKKMCDALKINMSELLHEAGL